MITIKLSVLIVIKLLQYIPCRTVHYTSHISQE